jgi:putative phosphoesterase
MTKIGLISDTHSHLDPKVFEYFKDCDEIWHAGDVGDIEVIQKLAAFKPVRGVYGNIDGNDVRGQYPLDNRFTVEGVDVWITHIGGYPGKYAGRVRSILQINPPKVFICGHSHILKVMRDPQYNNMLCLNPGAAGIEGFHKIKTLLRFSIDKGQVKDMEVVEMGRRGALPSSAAG